MSNLSRFDDTRAVSRGAGYGAGALSRTTSQEHEIAIPPWLSTLVRGRWLRWLLIYPIRGYKRFLSPLLPPACRFEPSCSMYAMEALEVHGAVKGSMLASWRIVRCNPFCAGGHDPVPPREHGLVWQSCRGLHHPWLLEDHDGVEGDAPEEVAAEGPQG